FATFRNHIGPPISSLHQVNRSIKLLSHFRYGRSDGSDYAAAQLGSARPAAAGRLCRSHRAERRRMRPACELKTSERWPAGLTENSEKNSEGQLAVGSKK